MNTTTEIQEATDMGLGKIQVQSVQLIRAEGRCSFTQPFMRLYKSFSETDASLREMATEAASDGSYNKISYKVTFCDGETYEGTINLKRHDTGHTGIIPHSMRSFVSFHAGRYCPNHMTQESYRRFLDRFGEETQKEYADFQDRYDF